VLNGSATFVTGGSVVEARSIAAEEIRGKEINGGETRRITKGDVIIVPDSVPHWFQKVDGPFTYYVVKVRSENGR
jgi:glc operon protein GlcG